MPEYGLPSDTDCFFCRAKHFQKVPRVDDQVLDGNILVRGVGELKAEDDVLPLWKHRRFLPLFVEKLKRGG